MKRTLTLFTVLFSTLSIYAWKTPTISAPANGNNTESSVTMNWNAVANSEGYIIEYDTSANFNSPIKQSIQKDYISSSNNNVDTYHNIKKLFFGQTYYWRVKAYITGDTSNWSVARYFRTKPTVDLALPINNTNTESSYTLDWNAYTDVDSYYVELDTTPLFNSPEKQSAKKEYTSSSNSQLDSKQNFSIFFFGKKYYWRVIAWHENDSSEWSETRYFKTLPEVDLALPINNSNYESSVKLDWNAYTKVDSYYVELDTTPLFNSPLKKGAKKKYTSTSNSSQDTEHTFSPLLFGQKYYWRVIAWHNKDSSRWSAPNYFNTLDKVDLYLPINNASIESTVELDWRAYTKVDSYYVELDTTPLFNSAVKLSAKKKATSTSNSSADTEHTFTPLYFGQKYHWRVIAWHAQDSSSWSETRTFTTLPSVSLNTPLNNTTSFAVGKTLDWLAYSKVDSYYVQVDSSPQFNSPELQSVKTEYYTTSNGGSDTKQLFQDFQYGTTYYWRVLTWHSMDSSEWSEVRTFNTQPIVKLVYPNQYQKNVSVNGITLNWDAYTYSEFYELELDTSPHFNSSQLVKQLNAYTTSSNSGADTKYSTGGLLADQIYYWRVKARNVKGETEWITRVFSTGNNMIPEIPTLVAPNKGEVNRNLSETLYWNTTSNTDYYIVDFAPDPNFKTMSQSTNVMNNYMDVSGLWQNTKYFWRVRSVNVNGKSFYSETWDFTTKLITSKEEVTNEVNLFPNPATNYVTLNGINSLSKHSVEIRDITGKKVLETFINKGENTINIGLLKRGSYLIKITDLDDQTIYLNKVIRK